MPNVIVTVTGPVNEIHDLTLEGPLLFTTPGTYTLTFNRSANIRVGGIAGGGGGASGRLDATQSRGGGGGGSGSSDASGPTIGVDPNQTYTAVVGSAGTAGSGSGGVSGGDGGDTSFAGSISGFMFRLGGGKAGTNPTGGAAGTVFIGSDSAHDGSTGGNGGIEQTATLPTVGGSNGDTGGGGGGGAGPSGSGSGINTGANGGPGSSESGATGGVRFTAGGNTIAAQGGQSTVNAYGGGGAGGGTIVAGIKRGGGGGGGGGSNSTDTGDGGTGSPGLMLITAIADVTPSGPIWGGGIARASKTRQYMAMAMPMATPAVVAAPTGIAATVARRPDYIRGRAELSAAHAPFFFSGPGIPNVVIPPPSGIAAVLLQRPALLRSKIELSAAHAPFYFAGSNITGTVQTGSGVIYNGDSSTLSKPIVIQYQALTGPVFKSTPRASWTTVYPDRIYKRGRRAQFAPYFGGFGIPGTQLTTAATGPIYPDKIDKKLNISWMPWNQFGPDPTTIPAPAVPSMAGWLGYQPDWIARRTIPTALIPSWLGLVTPSAFPITFASLSVYPDRIYRPTFLTALQRSLSQDLNEQGAPAPELSWRTLYPDYIWQKRVIKQQAWNNWIVSGDFITPELAWHPHFADMVLRPRFHASLNDGGTDPFSPAFPVTPIPSVVRPDWIARRLFSTSNQLASVFQFPGAPAPEYSWHGYQPDWIARAITPRWTWITDVSIDANRAVPNLSWAPSYPDWVARLRYLTAAQQFMALGSFGTISIPELSWQGYYPDYFRKPQGLGSINQPYWSLYPFPIPNPPSPELAWGPSYPDFARRRLIHASTLPYHVMQPLSNIPPPFGWNGQVEQPVRRKQRPEGTRASGYPVTTVSPEAWKPEYPSRIAQKKHPIRPSVFQSPIGTQFAIQQLEWRPIYPDRFWRLPNATNPFFLFKPQITESKTDCIEFEDDSVSFSCLVEESMTEAIFYDESLTKTSPSGEETC